MNWLMDSLYAMAVDTWVEVGSFCLLEKTRMAIISTVFTNTMKNEPMKERAYIFMLSDKFSDFFSYLAYAIGIMLSYIW